MNLHDFGDADLNSDGVERFKALALKVTCPACGSTDNWAKVDRREYTPPFGKTERYEVLVMHCTACTEEWTHEPGPDPKRVSAILQHADQATVKTMLDLLEQADYSQAAIRQVLGMEGYAANWRTGATEGVIALLRILATYPWILEVANAKFDPNMAEVAPQRFEADTGRLSTLSATATLLGNLGDPGVRDPSAPCCQYEPGVPQGHECEGDGHYLCKQCLHLYPADPEKEKF